MSDHLPAVVPPVTTTQAVVSSPELPPGESSVPSPTAEQQYVADRVFTDPHPAASLLGILSSAMLLRDVAVDTFDTSGDEDEEAKEKPEEPEA
ncbi:MAG TPA: hypothetical protein VMF69_09210 [Gemmataceae bacterium]|nr:hypothetical protein [Gemmataceae bacterium]